MELIKSSSFTYLTSGTCEDTGHWNPEQFEQLGITYDTRHVYPLTTTESKYPVEDMKGLNGTHVSGGYTVLYEGRKYFAPTIELPFDPPQREKTLLDVRDIAIRAYNAVAAFGGHVSIKEDDGPQEDRHTVIVLIPIYQVIDRLKFSVKKYNEWLASFFG